MSAIDDLKAAFRQWLVDGVPSSGANPPEKTEINLAFDTLQAELASIGSGILRYETKALLDANTTATDGQLAYVWGDATAANNTVYQSDAGAWSEATWYFDAIAAIVQPLVDAAEAAQTGAETALAEAETLLGPFELITSEEYLLALAVNDYVVFGVAPDGSIAGLENLETWMADTDAAIAALQAASADTQTADHAGPIAFRSVHAGYGQSNRNATGAFPRRSTAAVLSDHPGYGRLKFPDTGRFVTLSTATITGVTDAIEEAGSGETGMRVSSEIYAVRAEEETGKTLSELGVDVVAYSAAKGGSDIDWLLPGYTHGDGNQYFENLVRGFEDLWNLDNDTVCQVLTMIWGENAYVSGTSAATIKAGYDTILETFETRVKAINNQTVPVVMYFSQVAAHEYYGVATPTAALAQLEWVDEGPNRVLVSPTYPFVYNPTDGSPTDIGVHLAVDGTQWYGCLEGDAIATVQNGGRWHIPRVTDFWASGDVLTLVVDAEYDMVIDTSWVTDPGDYGFGAFDAADTPKTITSVEVVAGKYIKIRTSTDWIATDKWTYAWHGRVGGTDTSIPIGHETGSRGCVRDDRPGNYTTASGHTYPKHRYLPICGGTIS